MITISSAITKATVEEQDNGVFTVMAAGTDPFHDVEIARTDTRAYAELVVRLFNDLATALRCYSAYSVVIANIVTDGKV